MNHIVTGLWSIFGGLSQRSLSTIAEMIYIKWLLTWLPGSLGVPAIEDKCWRWIRTPNVDSPVLWMGYTTKSSLRMILGLTILQHVDSLRMLPCKCKWSTLQQEDLPCEPILQVTYKTSECVHFSCTYRLRKIPLLLQLFFAQLQLSCSFFQLKIVSLTHFPERLKQDLHPTICSHSCLHNQYIQTPSFLPLFTPLPPPDTTALCWLKLLHCSCQNQCPAASLSFGKELNQDKHLIQELTQLINRGKTLHIMNSEVMLILEGEKSTLLIPVQLEREKN